MPKDSDKPDAASGSNPAGGEATDDRNRNVWQWKGSPDDNTENLLKTLENDALQLEATRKVPIPVKSKPAPGESKPAPGESKPAPAESKPAPGESKPSSKQDEAKSTDMVIEIPGKAFDPYNQA